MNSTNQSFWKVSALAIAAMDATSGAGPRWRQGNVASPSTCYGLEFEFINGIRVTNPEAMAVVEQILSGAINKRIVARLNAAGVPALGLSGVDLGLIETVPLHADGAQPGQRSGRWCRSEPRCCARCWHRAGRRSFRRCRSIATIDSRSTSMQISAALAVAEALVADELVFVSNVPGVLIDGQVVPEMDRVAVETAIASGAIHGGMVPKVRAAIDALAAVRAVRICNLAGLGTWWNTLHNREGSRR